MGKELDSALFWVGKELKRDDLSPWEWFSLMKLNEAILDVQKSQSGPIVEITDYQKPSLTLVSN